MAEIRRAAAGVWLLTFVMGGPGLGQDLRFERFTDLWDLGCRGNVAGVSPSHTLEDYRGYLWCFSPTTLFRFDGVEAKRYRHDPRDSTSIGSSDINALFEDRSGFIWVGHRPLPGGIDRFDPVTETFERLYANPEPDSGHADDFFATVLLEDRNGDIWFGTSQAGLARIDRRSGDVERFKPDPGNPASLSGEFVTRRGSLLEDVRGNIWILVSDDWGAPPGTLHRFLPESRSFKRYDNVASGLEHNGVTALMEDRTGRLWIGTREGGLFLYDPDGDTFLRSSDSACPRRSDDPSHAIRPCSTLFQDASGKIWIGSEGGGLDRYDPATGRRDHFEHDPRTPASLPDDHVRAIWQTHEGILWMELGSDLYQVYPGGSWVRHYVHDPADPATVDPVMNKRILEDRSGRVWVAGSDGIGQLNRTTGRVDWIGADRRANVWDLLQTSGGELLAGVQWIPVQPTFGALVRLDLDRKVLEPVLELDYPTYARAIGEESSGVLWVGFASIDLISRYGGFVRYDMRTGERQEWDIRDAEPHTASIWPVGCFVRDRSGTIWVCADALLRYNRENGAFERALETGARVTSILEDSEDRLWLTTSPGSLVLYDRKTGRAISYGTESGLPSNRLGGLLEDDSGLLWIASDAGLSRFDPEAERFRTFTQAEGLLAAAYANHNLQNQTKLSDGTLLYGVAGAVSAVFPDRIVENTVPPRVFLERISVSGEDLRPALPGSSSNASWIEDRIVLEHGQNDLVFEYTAIHFADPSRIRFAYRMEGLDADWIDADSRRSVRYPDLRPGSYRFRVKAANSDGVWSESGAFVSIRVLPPWWATWWAYGLYALGALSLAYGGFRWRTNRIRRHAAELRTEVRERTRQLADEKRKVEEQAERLIALERTKDRFFANISHEFRTPLMLLQGPVQDVIDGAYGPIEERARRQLVLAKRSGKQLASLIDQLLDLSRLDVGQLHLQAEERDLCAFVRTLVDTFTSLADRNGIWLTFSGCGEDLRVHFDPGQMEKVVGNLIANAVKFTDRGGRVDVSTDLRRESAMSYAVITVRDTGIGIPASDLPRVFDRFYQVTQGGRRELGTGIGLALVREIVELHGGKVTVESEVGVGSTFSVFLTLGTEHLPASSPVSGSDEDPESEKPSDEEVYEFTDEGIEHVLPDATVLVVEDNDELRRYIASHLSKLCRVEEAVDGKDGLEKASALGPDLILADILMPRMDGLELCAAVKGDPTLNHIPVVLLTALGSPESKLDGLEAGADDYLLKPFDARELRARIENLIEIRRRLRARFSREVVVKPTDVVIQSDDAVFLDRVRSVVEAHLADSGFTIECLADEVALSPRHLYRRIEALTRLSPAGFIRLMRMERAAQLLDAGAGNVSEIALKVGYRNAVSFSRLFRQVFGVLPSEYRRG